jgi:endonuclease-3
VGELLTFVALAMPTKVKVNWPEALQPLLKKYKDKRFPLDYKNTYQLVLMVVLAAQDRDANVNLRAPKLFEAYPDMEALSKVDAPEDLFPYISGIRNFGHKAAWILDIAKAVKRDSQIPTTLEALTALPGIGRKSANVILREMGKPPEGVIVDIHVVRVAPRLGITKEEDPKKIEADLMKLLPRSEWDVGMAMSFLGREICKPKPDCPHCLMNPVCAWFAKHKKEFTG